MKIDIDRYANCKNYDGIDANQSHRRFFFIVKQSGMILLQTIPNHINIDSLKKELLEAFLGIVNVHDLHVWQLSGDTTIATAHIIFLNPKASHNQSLFVLY